MSILYGAAFAVVAIVILYALRRPVLRSIGSFLIAQENTPTRCDAIVLLNGHISTRAYRAAELYREYGAPILIARLADTEEVRLGVIPNISEATKTLLVRLDVPARDIQLIDSDRWIAGTWNEAILLSSRIRANGYRHVLIVTDAFHTRRARWAFRKVMRHDHVGFTCTATRFSMDLAGNWWRSEYGLINVVVEYLKFVHYLDIALTARRLPPPVEHDLPKAKEVRPMVSGRRAGE